MGYLTEISEYTSNLVFDFLITQIIKILWFLLAINVGEGCQVTECDLKLTPEHGAQISMVQQLGVTEADCLRRLKRIALSDYSGLYCPIEELCGLDLKPEYTKALKFLSNATCIVLAKDESTCEDLEKDLIKSGKYSSYIYLKTKFIFY